MLTPPPITIGTARLDYPTPTADLNASPLQVAKAILGSPYTLIDTSNEYTGGGSETTMGRAIAEVGLPESHHIVTKADAHPDTRRFDRDRVWESFDESTKRLGVDTFPIFHLHDPYTITFAEATGRGGAVQGMVELREQGLVGAIGIAAGPLSLMQQYVDTGAFDALLTHNRYTLVDRQAEPLLDNASNRAMTVFNAAPFGGGILVGKGTTYCYRESPPALLRWLETAKELCHSHGVSLPAAALQFSLRDSRIHSTVVGISKQSRLKELIQLEQAQVGESFWQAISSIGTPPSPLPN